MFTSKLNTVLSQRDTNRQTPIHDSHVHKQLIMPSPAPASVNKKSIIQSPFDAPAAMLSMTTGDFVSATKANFQAARAQLTHEKKKPRLSLEAGESRRDRFGPKKSRKSHQQREAPERPIAVVGRFDEKKKKAAKPRRTTFENIDDMFADSPTQEEKQAAVESATTNNNNKSIKSTPVAAMSFSFGPQPPPSVSSSFNATADFSANSTPIAEEATAKKTLAFDQQHASLNLNLTNSFEGSSDDDENNDFDDQGDMDMNMGENGPDEQQQENQSQEEEEETEEMIASRKAEAERKAAAKAARKAARGEAKRRRNTLLMIDQSEETGMADLINEGKLGTSKSPLGGKRHSARVKFAPLEFWRGQKFNIDRRDKECGHVLPSLTLEAPIYSPPKPAAKEKKPRTKKEGNKKKSSKKKNSKRKLAALAEVESDEEREEEEREINPAAWVNDDEANELKLEVIAKTASMVAMQHLQADKQKERGNGEAGGPLGGKAFEYSNFCSGMLELPPNCTKYPEVNSHATELFFISAAAKNGLEVKIHETLWTLSKGDSFFVPPGNTYYLKNKSKNKPVKLFFNLIHKN